MFGEAYRSVSLSVAGIGYGNPPEFCILGTGFLIHESGVVGTNWHVAESLLTEHEGQTVIRADACAVFFVRDPENTANEWVRGMLAVPVAEIGVPPEPATHEGEAPLFRGIQPDQVIRQERPDVALLRLDFSRVPEELRNMPPIERVVPRPLRVGEAVAICGFPQGLYFPAHFRQGDPVQLGPLLQVGQVAGVLPFDGVPVPQEYVLDIPVNKGSSGSPLFGPDATVLGIVYATRRAFSPLVVVNPDGSRSQSSDTGVSVPTSLGLAIPSTRFPREMITDHRTREGQP